MIAIRHILCPIDFSETSLLALTYAAAFASWYEADLDVLHVAPALEDDVTTLQSRVDAPPGLNAVTRDRITSEIGRAIAAAGAVRVNARALALNGRAHETIVHQAQAQPTDLLVMGTHGRSGFNRLLLGSVTEKVLRMAPCPVLTVPPAASPVAAATVTFKRILCPMDFSPAAVKALRYALDLGRQAGGSLTVLHALEYTDPDDGFELSPFDPCHEASVEGRHRKQHLMARTRERVHALLAQEPTTWCGIDEVVAYDRAYKAILRHAAETGADVIVMGAQGAGGLELMLYGSNTQHVVRAATCPVLTVRA